MSDREPAPVLMVQGTSSSAGKSTLVAGLCRLFARRGLRVAPFKAQNMSNNAAVCPAGGEIGRAQYEQARAARITPTVDMNPVLLKPLPGGSQVIVRGQAVGTLSISDYFGQRRRSLWPTIVQSLDHLRVTHDMVIAEGAGSPAEINLRDRDVANMAVALHAAADVLLVADIDRGGAFAGLLGTWEWLEPYEQALVRGFILNKFRGDASLLSPAPERLKARTGVPTLAVVPYLSDLDLADEDAATLADTPASDALVEIAVIRLPHIANFDEFMPLASEPGVSLHFVSQPESLRAPDLVILPGTRATIPDLLWLRERGLADRVAWLASHGTPILGICGGYQMLGRAVYDPNGIESDTSTATGLGLFNLETVLEPEKQLRVVDGTFAPSVGVWRVLSGLPATGYEIHQGRTVGEGLPPFVHLKSRNDGAVTADGLVAGTYSHGLLEPPAVRQALVRSLAAARGYSWSLTLTNRPDPFDRLADALEEAFGSSLDRLPTVAGLLKR